MHRACAATAMTMLLLAGCIAEQPWTTAETLPAGGVQHTVASQVIAKVDEPYTLCRAERVEDGDLFCQEHVWFSPSYTLRVGVHDRVEVAGHLSPVAGAGLEGKVHAIDGRVVDAGLAATVLASRAGGLGALRALVTFHLTPGFSVTLSPRAGYRLMPSWAESPANDDEGSAFFAGGGLALRAVVTPRVAVGLGASWAVSLGGDDRGQHYLTVGPFFSFGDHPGHPPGGGEEAP